MSASVKIMLSFDYCHFEICKGTDQELTNEQIDWMRKDCQRLADKAVKQYQIAKKQVQAQLSRRDEYENARYSAQRIEATPENQRTPSQMALLKSYQDKNWVEYIEGKQYDYEDDWREREDEIDAGELPF